ncbi:MAG: histidine kinase [Gemmatimonadaceae bacterium]
MPSGSSTSSVIRTPGLGAMQTHRVPAVRWWVVIAIWSLPAFVASYSSYIAASAQGRPVEFWRAFAMQGPGWYVWVPLTPIIFALAKRFPIARHSNVRAIAAHTALIIFALVIYTTVYVWSNVEFRRTPLELTPALVESVLIGSIVMTLVLYTATLVTSIALDYASRDRERERRTLELESQLARAELHTLRAQLHPHVLFNALHTIALLARHDSNEAIRVTVLLGNVLRSVLDSGATDERPLRDEISLIEQYLGIELVRFADRLTVVWEIQGETYDAFVPTLLLQPLVENALRHGIARSINGGTVVISSSRSGESVCVTVWNDGPALPGDGVARRGVGLRNTEERLQRLYGEAGHLSIRNDPRGGVMVRVSVPWRTVEVAVADDKSALAVDPYSRYSVTRQMDPHLVVAPTPNRQARSAS